MEDLNQDEPLVVEPQVGVEPQANPDDETKELPAEKPEGGTRWDGLSKEELLKVVQDQDSHIGERNQEIGELRGKVSTYEQAQQRYAQNFSNYSQQPPVEQSKPTTEEKLPDFNWDNPSVSVYETVDRRIAAKEKEIMQGQFNANLQRAQMAFEKGKQSMSEDPIFKGIEQEVENQVGQFYYPYLQQGVPVDQYLMDKEMWKKTARHIRLDRGEVDMLKADTSSAVKPTVTEIPSQTKTQEESPLVLELEPKDKEWARQMGLTDKEAKEIIAEELKARRA